MMHMALLQSLTGVRIHEPGRQQVELVYALADLYKKDKIDQKKRLCTPKNSKSEHL